MANEATNMAANADANEAANAANANWVVRAVLWLHLA